jgi:hypothetical protein
MLTDNVDWIPHRLEVTGPDDALNEFVMAAQGPGFINWTWPGGDDRAYWTALALRGGAPTLAAAERLARRYADYLWWTIGDARSAVDRGLLQVPLDLNALQPIPRKVLQAGWREIGRDWMWRRWGTCLPMRHVTFRFEHRRRKQGAGIAVAAVYEFEAADWTPWRAARSWKRRWPLLSFSLRPVYREPSSLPVATIRRLAA